MAEKKVKQPRQWARQATPYVQLYTSKQPSNTKKPLSSDLLLLDINAPKGKGIDESFAKKLAIYACSPQEEVLFRQEAKKVGVLPILIPQILNESNVSLAAGCCCISVNHTARVGAALLNALFDQGVRYISTRTIGGDHIDLVAAGGLGIVVETIHYAPHSVADYTMMLLLMGIRQGKLLLNRWEVQNYSLPEKPGRSLKDLTVGVVGTGLIGRAVIDRLQGFGCNILAHDLQENDQVKKVAAYVSLEQLLAKSDVVTLHIPATAATVGLINSKTIGQMKQGAVLVNTARGALIQTGALIRALKTGWLGAAALDVLENEGTCFYQNRQDQLLPNREICQLNSFSNVVTTAHLAFYTQQAVEEMVLQSLHNCLQFAKNLPAPRDSICLKQQLL